MCALHLNLPWFLFASCFQLVFATLTRCPDHSWLVTLNVEPFKVTKMFVEDTPWTPGWTVLHFLLFILACNVILTPTSLTDFSFPLIPYSKFLVLSMIWFLTHSTLSYSFNILYSALLLIQSTELTTFSENSIHHLLHLSTELSL